MALIENYIHRTDIVWQPLFHKSSFRPDYEQDKKLKPVIDFLCSKLSFWYYKDIMSENPFKPSMDFTASGYGRSADIIDLEDKDIAYIEKVLKFTKHSLLQGFIYDVLGIIKKEKIFKLLASKHFIDYAKSLMGNDNHFGLLLRPLERAFALIVLAKDNAEAKNFIDFIFNDVVLSKHKNSFPIKVAMIDLVCMNYRKAQNSMLNMIEKLYAQYENDREYLPYLIRITKLVMDIYKSKQDSKNSKVWAIKHAEQCCNLEFFLPDTLKTIDKAINFLNDIDFEWTNKLRFKKQEMQKQFYDQMNMQTVSIPLDEKLAKDINDHKEKLTKPFKVLDGVGQFCYLLKVFQPLTQTGVDKQLADRLSNPLVLSGVFNNIRFNDDNEIIYQSAHATEEQKVELDKIEIYVNYHKVLFDFIFMPFLWYVKLDDELKNLLKDICENNLLVQKDSNLVLEYVLRGMNKGIRSALADLIPQFEDSCRLYIQNRGIFPVMRKGSKDIKVTLNEMFREQQFRTVLDELLGEELTQSIEVIACKELGSNIRNRYFHKGHGNDEQVTTDEMALFFLLIKAYCMGYEPQIKLQSKTKQANI